MKFHTLTVTAFGPFAGTETVDFDALGADGLFLMRGPTGSGKTSVLDAVTFALYGDVAGERQPDQLKSQHAPADRVPHVELDFSRGEDRYKVNRQPAYMRPAKRAGAKPQKESPKLTIHRLVAGKWQPVQAAKIAEADLELRSIIGLSLSEFTKVILLPQGAFAQLLHASNEERRGILEQLFDIDIYHRLEDHLWTWMREAEGELKQLNSRIEVHAESLRTAAETLLGDQQDECAGIPFAAADVEELAEVTTRAAQKQLSQLKQKEQTARSEAEKAEASAETLRGRREELLHWQQHCARYEAHEQHREEAERAREAVTSHHAAGTVREWLTAAETAATAQQQAYEQAREAAETAEYAVSQQYDIHDVALVPDTAQVRAAADAAAQEDSEGADHAAETATYSAVNAQPVHADALAEAQQEVLRLTTRLTEADADTLEARYQQLQTAAREHDEAASTAADEIEQLSANQAQTEERLAQLRAQLMDTEELDTRRDAAHTQAESADSQVEAARRRDELLARLDEQGEEVTACQQNTAKAEAEYRHRSEGHLQSLAHELAGELSAGQPCLVCGSAEHPAPLTADTDTVTREQVDAAAASLQEARGAQEKARAAYHSTEEKITQLRQELGSQKDCAVDELRQQALQARQHRDQLDQIRTEQRSIRTSIEELSHSASQLREKITAREQQRDQQLAEAHRKSRDADELWQRLAELRGCYNSVAERLEKLRDVQVHLDTAQQHYRAWQTARAEADRTSQAAAAQLAASEFDTAGDVIAAQQSPQFLEELQKTVTEFDQTHHHLQFEAQQDYIQSGRARAEAGEGLPPREVVEGAAQTAEQARRHCDDHERVLTEFSARYESLQQTAQALNQALEDRQEQAAEHQRRAELAETVNGKGDNVMKMRLTTFVLAARLERIADVATRHLHQMTDGRYQLLLDASRAGRGLRGLDLKVLDEYAEQERPAESLSGGETFMTALAMALGLAEVVQAEAGGIDMESLFIDEGFGSLDEATLEAVMSSLHTLQGQGRRIGVVSHVTEMHQQIPTQLHVVKGRQGSTLTSVVPQ